MGEYEHDPPPKAAHHKTPELLVPQLKSRRDSTSPQRLARQLTKHVVTRWYRSVGCILAELLSMQKESVAAPEDRAALFPGSSCFPLSHENPLAYTEQVDQLNGTCEPAPHGARRLLGAPHSAFQHSFAVCPSLLPHCLPH